MGRIVIACYKPKPGLDADLRALMRTHVPTLRAEGLVTDRTPMLMRAADGTIVEVFEWLSQDAIDRAHSNPAVLAMWERYAQVCEYTKIGDLPEASQLFSGFEPLD
jgi:hypothetical protein